jgi:hypothetical protein
VLAPSLEPRGGPDTLAFLLLLLLNLSIALPLGVFPTVLEGLEQYPARSAVRIGFLLLRSAAAAVAVTGGLLPLAAVFLLATVLEHAAYIALCRYFLPSFSVRPWRVPRSEVIAQWSAGRDAFLAFSTALRLIDYARTALRTITATLTPGIARLDAAGDREAIRERFLLATRGVLYLGLPVQLGVWAFGGPFLRRWLGETVADAAAVPLAILGGTLVLTVVQSTASRVLYGLGELRIFARLALAEGLIAVALTAVLAGPLGLAGAAWASAIPHAAFCAAVVVLTVRTLAIPASQYRRAIVSPLAAGTIPLAIWAALPAPAADYAELALHAAAGLVPYCASVLCSERTRWWRFIFRPSPTSPQSLPPATPQPSRLYSGSIHRERV